MKKILNVFLVVAIVVPTVMIFWPFAMWNDAMSLILRVIPSFALQILLFRVGKWNIIKALPILITGFFAALGLYRCFNSQSWSNATFGGIVADYVSPFLSCVIALVICLVVKKKKCSDL